VSADGPDRSPVQEIVALDRLVHEPARLAILTALSACASADFPYLARITGLTHGNLASHLDKLESAGLVAIEKSFQGRTPSTTASLTSAGRSATEEHWVRLENLREKAAHFVTGRALPRVSR
jgi:DNA-binding MarR family transcriptional regulator